MTTAADGGMADLWCRACGEPVKRHGERYIGKVVHAATGLETGADGHLAVPTGTDPVKAAVCRAVEADYPEYEVGWCFRSFFRAVIRSALVPVPVEASTEEELRFRLDAQRTIRRLARPVAVSTPGAAG